MSIKEVPNEIALIGFIIVLFGPGAIGIVVSAQTLKAIRKEQDTTGDRRERNGMERGYTIAMDGVRMITHTKIAQDEVIDVYLDDGDKDKISMQEYTLRRLQNDKEKRFNKY